MSVHRNYSIGKNKFNRFLVLMLSLLMLLITLLGTVQAETDASEAAAIPEHYGASPEMVQQVTGDPLGGGEGYNGIVNVADADYVVDTKDELLDAMGQAVSGEIVYVPNDVEIDLTSLGTTSIIIPEGVTLASGRGQGGSSGGLLFTDYMKDMLPNAKEAAKHKIDGVFKAGGPDVRITGLRLRGNHEDIGVNPGTGVEIAKTYDLPTSLGIKAGYAIEIDNNEIYNFSYAGIYAHDAKVHHNYLHHTQRKGLGYGIIVVNFTEDTTVLAEGNIFDYFRHAIAGSGQIMESYEARYNLIKNGTSHSLDMHTNGKESDYLFTSNGGVFMAGNTVKIHHNTFTDTTLDDGWGKLIAIRGLPAVGAYVDYNWFHNKDPYDAAYQRSSFGNFFVGKNAYGMNEGSYDTIYDGVPMMQMLTEDNKLVLLGEDVRQNQDGKLNLVLPLEKSEVIFPALVTPIYLWKLEETEVLVGDQKIILSLEWFKEINQLIPADQLNTATISLKLNGVYDNEETGGKNLDFSVSYITADGQETAVTNFETPITLELKFEGNLEKKKSGVYQINDDKNEVFIGGTVYGDVLRADVKEIGQYGVLDN